MKNFFDKLFNREVADLPTHEVADLSAHEVVDVPTCAILKLPHDILKMIMVRVAATPTNGGFEVHNSSFTCKEFLKLSQEECVLKSAVFGDMPRSNLPDSLEPNPVVSWGSGDLDQLVLQLQVVNRMGGYIFKAAKAGNLSAQLLLAKLIIRSFSEVFEATNEALRSESVDIEKSRKRAIASSFISYFEHQTNASNEVDLLHSSLVKTFLKKASIEELQQMKPYLDDYVLKHLINITMVSTHYLMFHIKLEALTDSQDTYLLRQSTRTSCKAFHDLCSVARSTMQRLGVSPMIPHKIRLASMKVKKDEHCSKTLIDCFNGVNDLLIEGYTKAYYLGHIILFQDEDNPQVVPITMMVERFLVVQECLSNHLRLIVQMSKIRNDLISEFDMLFPS